ncbi:hypothetical protein IZT14_001706 [Clostridium perfringens]|uniref:hypothetical protein n=1 Tax=Clostridium perfringens TaxID=1502 RepID=UPI000D9C4A50|nr:hypothetical protein [Clostridium perfringens]EGT0683314.1 hypothetical protein [Clostridium perfringens]EGT0685744.1 hypothetical protein [Clostridium perfringens]MDM0892515.1 hypothetical protein [Clostridium perfringens]MDU1966436.1 hypothetical protein [Clostridium perfringens]PWX46144.1 hypothetical protein CYK83_03290 [Clostridium perfringens]
MEKEFCVKPVLVKYMCDFCNEGEMIPNSKNYWSLDPPKFEHKCNKCGKKIILDEKYPIMRYIIG